MHRTTPQVWKRFGEFPDEIQALARRELLAKINAIPGIHFDETVLIKLAKIQFESLMTTEAMNALRAIVTWLIERMKAECEEAAGV